jgi:predicted ABC-type transport system involved in lysophospholipase L1 biosynthesis ATPase subunit
MASYVGWLHPDNDQEIRKFHGRRRLARRPLVLDAVTLTLPSAAGPVNILRGVDLAVAPGERVAMIGPSGSGKSSLIAVGAGLEQPTAGTVRLFGQDLAKLTRTAGPACVAAARPWSSSPSTCCPT